jgi:hypothetical protein
MKLLITIPTYRAHPDGHRPGDGVYDHPTLLNTPGTLGRTLESLARLREVGDASVVVVAAATAPGLRPEVERQVQALVGSYARTSPASHTSGTRWPRPSCRRRPWIPTPAPSWAGACAAGGAGLRAAGR